MTAQAGIVYWPTESGSVGRVLGVSLSPAGRKTCNFNCAYCPSGWTDLPARAAWPPHADVIATVADSLAQAPGVEQITVAGNGEPTLHPEFARIVDDLCQARARLAPRAKLVLQSNGSTLDRLDVMYSLARFDERCFKLDAGDATTFRLLDAPPIPLGRLIADLRFVNHPTLRATFVRDAAGLVDNTTPLAVEAWLEAVASIAPVRVELSTIPGRPRTSSLTPVPDSVLAEIAGRVTSLGIPSVVTRRYCPAQELS